MSRKAAQELKVIPRSYMVSNLFSDMIDGTLEEVGTSPKVVDWTLPKYFQLPQDVGFCVYSKEFIFNEVRYRFAAQPHGSHRIPNVMVLALYGIEKRGINRWELEMRRANGTLLRKCVGFIEDGEEMLMRMYIPSEEVTRGCNIDDSLKVRCTLYCADPLYMADRRTENLKTSSTQTERIAGPDQLACDLEELMLREDYTDVVIKVEDKNYKAHKSILAVRNPVFTSMFKYKMSENLNGVVEIDDCDAGTFREFMRFMYSARVSKFATHVLASVYQLADKYQANELKDYCVEHIMDYLEVETFCDAIVIPLQYDERELMETLTDYFAKNMEEIRKTEKWQNFEYDNPEASEILLVEALKLREIKYASKENIFQKFIGKIKSKK